MTTTRRPPAGANARLRLLATTDLHMNLTSYDYYADRPDPSVGLTRTASLIRRERARAESEGALVLLFDNGDGLQGTPLGDVARERAERPHPLMRAFGELRYDAIGLGNHDFNFGLKPLETALRHAPCPVLCSNLRRVHTGKPAGFQPFAILDRMVRSDEGEWPIRIGVLSVLPPQTVTWDAHVLQGELQAGPIVQSVRQWLPDLRAAGCDVIVALAHTGLRDAPERPDLENAALPLAALDGIDAVICGHTHRRLPGPDHDGLDHVDAGAGTIHGKPAVMAGAFGSDLGVIDLRLTATPEGRWTPTGSISCLHRIASRTGSGQCQPQVEEDPEIARIVSEDHAQTRALMGQPAGHSTLPLHSYFTFFAPDRALALVAAAQGAALHPFLQGTAAEGLPIVSAAAPGKFGGRAGPGHYTDVPAGPLSLRHIADLHIFPNQLCAAIVTGQQLLDWLEMSASLFHQIAPGGTGQLLVNPEMPGHDFDVLHGISYQIDLSRPARFRPDGSLNAPDSRRIRRPECAGTAILPDARFVVAFNSYRASGGGPFAMLERVKPIAVPPIPLREAIRDHIAGRHAADPLRNAPPPWRFAPMPGTVVTALTGPGAATHLDELDGRGIVGSGLTPDGFLRLAIPL